MAMKWTDDQQSVLDVRNKNVLVSAAAGSGKTAVLVERIVRLVTQDGVDVDRLLVVTFTNAAAGEMSERILAALEKKAKEEPDNEHLQKQLSYIHNGNITTIDSFCLNVVRQYFNMIDVDPSFKIGDEGELKLLKEDVMKELLEKYYNEGNEKFLEFVNDYSSNRSDEKIEELITRLYTFSMSYPFPEKWLDSNIDNYSLENKPMEEQPWYKYINGEIQETLIYILQNIETALNIAGGEYGPATYMEALLSDKLFLEQIIKEKDYDKRVTLLNGYKPVALSRKKQPDSTDEGAKEKVKDIRDGVKKQIKTLTQKYYGFSMNTIMGDIKKCGIHVQVLTELTKDFIKMYQSAKLDKNIIDFNDMEHMALKILVKVQENGKMVPTDVARELGRDIDEIMIDEYQDSNLVQETILSSVSSCENGKNNIFMVGDVKQSIYKFRLARPELFLHKYNTYSVDDNHSDRKITLSKNFRSRIEVLEGANLIFSQIMSRNLGGIQYDSHNALYYGADYKDFGMDNSVELLVADTSQLNRDDEENGKELEAVMVANRIEEMINSHYQVRDKKNGGERDIKYSDIAILLRSFGDYGQTYADVLNARGIPVKSPSETGYFDTFEVQNILNMLSIIDNPRQDIPLAAVMRNIFRFSDEELAKIKIHGNGECFWEDVSESGDEKVIRFRETIDGYRDKSTYTSIYDIIDDIIITTGFGYFIMAMKAGRLRMANIEMLKEKALDYENTSYSGLFNFVRYIERLKKYSSDQGGAAVLSGGNFVTLMTIHKSKGLEFPVVFVGASGKKFNKMDTRGAIVMDLDLGVGLNYLDRKSGIKASTLIKESIAMKIEKENMAEELRIFYVALTRAKEKLIIAGNGDIFGKLKKYTHLKYREDISIPSITVFKAADYLEWVLMSIIRHKSSVDILKEINETVNFSGELFEHPAKILVKIYKPEELVYDRLVKKIQESEEKINFLNWDTDYIYNDGLRKEIKSLYSYTYPFENDVELKGKISVSDIKHMFIKMYDDDSDVVEQEISGFVSDEKPVPLFVSNDKEVSGALRGTAYHRIFELLDYSRFNGLENMKSIRDELELQLMELMEKGLAPDEYFEMVKKEKLIGFISSAIGKRVIKASVNKKFYKEKQFVIGITADNIDSKYSKDERVLVQGIVDGYLEEDNQLVILDYKTDNIKSTKDLYARYKAQLDYYAIALEQITGKKVKEKILYSVKLNEEYIY